MVNDPRNQSGGQIPRGTHEQTIVRSATAGVHFDFEQGGPPVQSYIGVDDFLSVNFASNHGNGFAIVNVRVLTADGLIHPLQFTTPANNSPALSFRTFALVEGFLLSVTAVCSGNTGEGNPTYIEVGLARAPLTNASVYRVLIAGYFGGQQPLCWPDSPQVQGRDGNFFYNRVASSTPAAGAEFIFTVPANVKWRIVSVSGLLTTAVAVANRDVTLVIDDGANILAQIPAGFALAASLANQYTFADSVVQSPAFNNVSMAPLPSNLIIPAGFRVRSLTANIQAADQWSGVNVFGGELIANL